MREFEFMAAGNNEIYFTTNVSKSAQQLQHLMSILALRGARFSESSGKLRINNNSWS